MSSENILQQDRAERLNHLLKKLVKAATSFSPVSLLTDDAQYKRYFIKEYLPGLYQKHTSEEYASCIFCANLVRSRCHSNCLKCSVGTYIRCSPSLPGVIYKESSYSDETESIPIPWYYRKPCYHFNRLPLARYHKNIYPLLSPVGIHHFEILEGLETGLCSDTRPCYICASVNYELYRECSSQEDFEENTPCRRIKAELEEIFESQQQIARSQ